MIFYIEKKLKTFVPKPVLTHSTADVKLFDVFFILKYINLIYIIMNNTKTSCLKYLQIYI